MHATTALALCALTLPSVDERLALADGFTLELEARWGELVDTVYGFEENQPLCRGWEPAVERAAYGADDFRPLLPPAEEGDAAPAVGDVWRLDARDFLPFLRQLHPGATAELHHGRHMGQVTGLAAEGAWGCLRSLTPERAELLLRVHAEFVLAGDGTPGETSYLTPAQFEGRMVIDRRSGAVTAFRLELPDASANADLNVAADGAVIADIGRVTRMELAGGEPLSDEAAAGPHGISLDDARGRLARRFYPFAEVDWLALDEALAESRASGRPLHVVLLFGSLEDESC